MAAAEEAKFVVSSTWSTDLLQGDNTLWVLPGLLSLGEKQAGPLGADIEDMTPGAKAPAPARPAPQAPGAAGAGTVAGVPVRTLTPLLIDDKRWQPVLSGPDTSAERRAARSRDVGARNRPQSFAAESADSLDLGLPSDAQAVRSPSSGPPQLLDTSAVSSPRSRSSASGAGGDDVSAIDPRPNSPRRKSHHQRQRSGKVDKFIAVLQDQDPGEHVRVLDARSG
jgi:hypothetical protein